MVEYARLLTEHLHGSNSAVQSLGHELERIERWGRELATGLLSGCRVLAVGNGGSAAEAQHLTAELLGRYRDDRRPLSAIALHGDTSALTAIANDYGFDATFARQVEAHGRRGDYLIVLSTSGRSPNLVAAARVGKGAEMRTLALTGPVPNPVAEICDDCLAVPVGSTAHIQEAHLVAVHLLCEVIDESVRRSYPANDHLDTIR